MPFVSPVILAVGAVLLLAVGGEGFLLKRSYEAQGALQTALTTATYRLKEINEAQKERDKVDGTVRALPDDKLFDGLLK